MDEYREFGADGGTVLIRRDKVSAVEDVRHRGLLFFDGATCKDVIIATAIRVEGRAFFVPDEHADVVAWVRG